MELHSAVSIAESSGAKATVKIKGYAQVTYNDPKLTAKMAVPTINLVRINFLDFSDFGPVALPG